MSLKEKYDTFIDAEKHNERIKENRIASLQYYEQCGLGKADTLFNAKTSEPLVLQDKAQSLVNEAVELIKDEKWKQTKLSFDTQDICQRDTYVMEHREIGNGPEVYYVELTLKNEGVPFYVKIRSPEGTVNYGVFRHERVLIKKGGLFLSSKVSSAKSQLVEEVNCSLSRLKNVLIGDQRFVVWDYTDRCNDRQSVLLFRDGTMFQLGGLFVSNPVNDMYNGNMLPPIQNFENWLLGKIKVTNEK